jgi:hypothetical protein
VTLEVKTLAKLVGHGGCYGLAAGHQPLPCPFPSSTTLGTWMAGGTNGTTGGRDGAVDREGPAHGHRSRARGHARAEQTCHADNRIDDEVTTRQEQLKAQVWFW